MYLKSPKRKNNENTKKKHLVSLIFTSTTTIRQYYFRNKNITNNENDIRIMINNKDWIKLLDPYTLNCIIQLYMKSNNNDNYIVNLINNVRYSFFKSCEKIMICWTVKTLLNNYGYGGILFNYVFILITFNTHDI